MTNAQRWIMHMDMDAFFASIEQMDDPSLKGRPVIVGGGHRGVVSTCSYEARRYGVHSAMPMSEARRLCPQAVYVRPRMRRYAELSARIRELLGQFSPLVEMASVDEAYLDATGLERIFGSVERMGWQLKRAVTEITGGLTCSVGIAPVKFLAKISSEQRKPDGLFLLAPEDVSAFLHRLPVTDVPGVGRHFAAALSALGVKTCGDVLRYSEDFWARRFGKAGLSLWDRAMGVDPRPVVPWAPPKSESAEVTLDEDTLDRELLCTWLMRHAERVGASLRRAGLAGRTVTVKVKYADFRQVTRQISLPERISSTAAIYEAARTILDGMELAGSVRLIGLRVSGFEDGPPVRLSLLDEEDTVHDERRRGSLDTAVDALRERYGRNAVMRGRLFATMGGKDREKAASQEDKAESRRIRGA
ncbi:DNA polymerase IV [uncultured Mailhella sp.]|uniref:DNA polymerase IV n=1 Tax=uncultured Mailhella sp. TaxID=1981031 RepID=UPI00262E9BB5|nr:DNA polymerase IV [uncultured Mailhella sp.]